MDFSIPNITDKEILDKYIGESSYSGCDATFSNIFLWRNTYDVKWAVTEGVLIVKTTYNGETSFAMPMGNGDKAAAIVELEKYCADNNIVPRFHGIKKENEEMFNDITGNRYAINYYRDEDDYVYLTEDLINLSGKKYHGKKNHINALCKNNEWRYEKLDDNNREQCIEMLAAWAKENEVEGDAGKTEEYKVASEALKYYKELGLVGGVLYVDDRVVAFTLGEVAAQDTFIVHIEKAYASVRGAYPLINREFLRNEGHVCKYVNREDDAGVEGLRKAKLSYNPVFMIEKANAKLK